MSEQYVEGQQRLPPNIVAPTGQMLNMHGMRPPPPGMMQVPPPMGNFQQLPPPMQMWNQPELSDNRQQQQLQHQPPPQQQLQQHNALIGKLPPPGPTQMSQMPPTNLNRTIEQARENNSNGNMAQNQSIDGSADTDDVDENDDKIKKSAELVLPKVLEDVLALKDQRAAQFHVNAEDFSAVDGNNSGAVIANDYADADGESDDEQEPHMNGIIDGKKNKESRADKNKKKKRRKKFNKKLRKQRQQQHEQTHLTKEDILLENIVEEEELNAEKKIENGETNKTLDDGDEAKVLEEKINAHDDEKTTTKTDKRKKERKDKDKEKSNKKSDSHKKKDKTIDIDVQIEYVPEKITIADLAPMYRQFYRVFEIFKIEQPPPPTDKEKSKIDAINSTQKRQEKPNEEDDDVDEEQKDEKEKLSKRKLKKLTRLSVAELKQLVSRPDVVEMHDVTARDPKLLVQLKAYRNTVQVPRHWCFKRKYLQGKRGIEKPPFELPAFIKKTGIMEMRESLQERDEAKSLKSKMRERVRPKMGKIDIDYQKLHDAFFKWQTKPRMTIHGDLYYEGKEFETRLKEKKPGDLSEELRIALGMPVGPNSHKIPPPWLIAQQRYGPPPSYPNLKIPGLNAPIPEGTSFGYHAGGWGKPPVDELGKPLYGDVFGTNVVDMDNCIDEGDIERAQWGELESESEESSEEEEEEGEDMANQNDETGLVTPVEGLVTPSGLTSGLPAGLETPETIELRKKKIETEMDDNETPVLYQVLAEKRTDRVGASMMGSTHVYDLSSVNKQTTVRTAATTDREGIVELALDPSELDLDNEAMAQRYEQQMREQQNHLQKEDLSDLLAEHVARQKSKRKRAQGETTKTNKKYKEFKF